MPKSRGRKPKRRPTRSSQAGQPASPPDIAPVVLKAMSEAMLDTDPVGATTLISQVLGMAWGGSEYGRLEAVSELAAHLATSMSLSHPASLLTLTVLAELAPDDVRPLIVERRDVCRVQRSRVGPERPWWLPAVGDVALRDVVMYEDVYGDQTNVLLGFAHRRPDGEGWFGEHTLIVLADHNLMLIKDAMVRPGLEPLEFGRELATFEDGVFEVPADEQWIADTVTSYLRLTDMTLGEKFGDESAETRMLVGARLRSLPAAQGDGVSDAYDTWPEPERARLVSSFMRTKTVSELCGAGPASIDRPSRETVSYIARILVDYRCGYTFGNPRVWSPTSVELFLTDWAPRKVLWEDEDARWVSEVLSRWVEYGGRSAGIPKRFRDESLAAVVAWAPVFEARVEDGSELSLGGQVVAQMQADGVDLTDPQQMQAWVEEYNASLPIPLPRRD